MSDSLLANFTPGRDGDSNLDRLNRVTITLADSKAYTNIVTGASDSALKNLAGINLEGLFMPYQGPHGSGSMLPMLASGVSDSSSIDAYDLLPFRVFPDGVTVDRYGEGAGAIPDTMNGVVGDVNVGGDIQRFRNEKNFHSIGLRLPMIGVGWGFDLSDEPVPAGSGSSSLFKGEVPSGCMVDPKDYIAAPIDLRYDADRGVWAAGGGMSKHRHLTNSASDGGPSFSSFFADDLAEASGLGYLKIVPTLAEI